MAYIHSCALFYNLDQGHVSSYSCMYTNIILSKQECTYMYYVLKCNMAHNYTSLLTLKTVHILTTQPAMTTAKKVLYGKRKCPLSVGKQTPSQLLSVGQRTARKQAVTWHRVSTRSPMSQLQCAFVPIHTHTRAYPC